MVFSDVNGLPQAPQDKQTWFSVVRQTDGMDGIGHWFLFIAKDEEPGWALELEPQGESAAYVSPSEYTLPEDKSKYSKFTMRSLTDEEIEFVFDVAARVPAPTESQRLDNPSWCLRVITALTQDGLLNIDSVRGFSGMVRDVLLDQPSFFANLSL